MKSKNRDRRQFLKESAILAGMAVGGIKSANAQALGSVTPKVSPVKMIICVRRKPGMTHEEFDRYWRENHAPLAMSVPEFIRHVRKYVQCHIVPSPLGTNAEIDGISEFWFDSLEEVKQLLNAPHYMEILRPDELKFTDVGKTFSVITEEVPMYG